MGSLSEAKWCLLGCLIVVVVLTALSVFVPGRLVNSVGRVADSELAVRMREMVRQEEVPDDRLVELIVEDIVVSMIDYQPLVVLKQKGGDCYLPIGIGLVEANAISVMIEGVRVPRPLTPDLLCAVIDRMEASVDYIVINNLQNDIFYANIILHTGWVQMEIDSRPSDAIAIALRENAPIYVEPSVLEKAGILPENETEQYTPVHL